MIFVLSYFAIETIREITTGDRINLSFHLTFQNYFIAFLLKFLLKCHFDSAELLLTENLLPVHDITDIDSHAPSHLK